MALPTLIDPRKLANQGIVLEGQFHDQHLPRLAEAVASIETPLSALIKFEIDEARAKVASGTLRFQCRQYASAVLIRSQLTLSSDFAAQVIWSEDQMCNVPSDREPWIVVDKMASLNELLEDEILLALPTVNYHENGLCTGDTFLSEDERGNNGEDDQVVADNPFNILQQLKK